MKERNEEKAKILYDYLDQQQTVQRNFVVPEDRSLMNVPFVWATRAGCEVCKEATAAGFVNLKATAPLAVCVQVFTMQCRKRAWRSWLRL